MTNLIQEVRAALQAATPGPWEQDDEPYVLGNGQVVCRLWHFNGEYQNQDNNAHLIANSPTWLQQLTERLEATERQRDEAVKALEWYADKKVWTVDVHDQWQPFTQIGVDGGKLARATLKRIKGDL